MQGSVLSWATPLLQDNVAVVVLVLLFVAADVLAYCPKGVMRHQLKWITDTRSARSFEASIVIFPWLRTILIVQMFLCFGLSLYCLTDDAPSQHLLNPDASSLHSLGLCIGALLGWYLVQWMLIRWFCYLFGITDKFTIMNRSYHAIFILLAPFATLCLILQISGLISNETTLNLLAALFILSQIGFIFNGIKIFLEGYGSFCLIFAYLCALEIAPLLIFWGKYVQN